VKIILSTNGFEIHVSDEDFGFLNQWKWCVILQDNLPRGIQRNDTRRRTSLPHEILRFRGVHFKDEIDHKDRDTLNNQIENLRPATRSQNTMNQGLRSNNTSGYKGVCFDRSCGRYSSRISCRKQKFHLGYFNDPVIAAKAYDVAAKHYHGNFAVLNFPETV
jgi:hypothetical protein